MTLPDEFKCVVTTWDYIYSLCRNVANDVKESGYEPDIIIALARGGWFAGRVMCDFLGLDDLSSLKVEHYVGTAVTGDEPHIRYPLADSVVKGKNVLIVDDIVDTGKSMVHAMEYVYGQDPCNVKTSSLQYLKNSKIKPDYCGEILQEWAWIVYPWNFIEDMTDIVFELMLREKRDAWNIRDVRNCLYRYHSIDPISFEIAQPGRMNEIMEELEWTGKAVSFLDSNEKFWKLAE